MQPYQAKFIQLALDYGALAFGTFTLKSGRSSSYFFNVGQFIDGAALAALGGFYADLIQQQFPADFDVIFGPAYKGIPLATSTAIALTQKYQQSYGVSFNRKEPKNHGEGGLTVGAALTGKRVLVIDDVITAGTAFRDAATIITQAGGQLAGLVTALDRQEAGLNSTLSAMDQIKQNYSIPAVSIITRADLFNYISEPSK
jgi:orotate phosphoribosyltransferase